MTCGTPNGYHQHLKRGEKSCPECLDSHNSNNRHNRAKLRGGPDKVLRGCGTEAAYNRHIKRGDVACRACKDAHSMRSRLTRNSSKTGEVAEYKRRIIRLPVELFAALWFTADVNTLAQLDEILGKKKVDQWVQEAGF